MEISHLTTWPVYKLGELPGGVWSGKGGWHCSAGGEQLHCASVVWLGFLVSFFNIIIIISRVIVFYFGFLLLILLLTPPEWGRREGGWVALQCLISTWVQPLPLCSRPFPVSTALLCHSSGELWLVEPCAILSRRWGQESGLMGYRQLSDTAQPTTCMLYTCSNYFKV